VTAKCTNVNVQNIYIGLPNSAFDKMDS